MLMAELRREHPGSSNARALRLALEALARRLPRLCARSLWVPHDDRLLLTAYAAAAVEARGLFYFVARGITASGAANYTARDASGVLSAMARTNFFVAQPTAAAPAAEALCRVLAEAGHITPRNAAEALVALDKGHLWQTREALADAVTDAVRAAPLWGPDALAGDLAANAAMTCVRRLWGGSPAAGACLRQLIGRLCCPPGPWGAAAQVSPQRVAVLAISASALEQDAVAVLIPLCQRVLVASGRMTPSGLAASARALSLIAVPSAAPPAVGPPRDWAQGTVRRLADSALHATLDHTAALTLMVACARVSASPGGAALEQLCRTVHRYIASRSATALHCAYAAHSAARSGAAKGRHGAALLQLAAARACAQAAELPPAVAAYLCQGLVAAEQTGPGMETLVARIAGCAAAGELSTAAIGAALPALTRLPPFPWVRDAMREVVAAAATALSSGSSAWHTPAAVRALAAGTADGEMAPLLAESFRCFVAGLPGADPPPDFHECADLLQCAVALGSLQSPPGAAERVRGWLPGAAEAVCRAAALAPVAPVEGRGGDTLLQDLAATSAAVARLTRRGQLSEEAATPLLTRMISHWEALGGIPVGDLPVALDACSGRTRPPGPLDVSRLAVPLRGGAHSADDAAAALSALRGGAHSADDAAAALSAQSTAKHRNFALSDALARRVAGSGEERLLLPALHHLARLRLSSRPLQHAAAAACSRHHGRPLLAEHLWLAAMSAVTLGEPLPDGLRSALLTEAVRTALHPGVPPADRWRLLLCHTSEWGDPAPPWSPLEMLARADCGPAPQPPMPPGVNIVEDDGEEDADGFDEHWEDADIGSRKQPPPAAPLRGPAADLVLQAAGRGAW